MDEGVIRPAGVADLLPTYNLFLAAANDLRARSGRELIVDSPARRERALAFRRHALATDPDGCWVVGTGGQLAGFGIATLRENVWYLAALHVAPGWQGRGLGRNLLQRCLSTGGARRTIRTTISEASQPVSNALYVRHGLFQWIPLLHLAGNPAMAGLPTASVEPVSAADDAAMAELAALDQAALSIAREADHRFWLARPDMTCLLARQRGVLVGYAYVSSAGGIGPVVGRAPRMMPDVLAAALGFAVEQGIGTCSVRIPGVCRTGVAFLMELGFRLDADVDLLLASRPFGRFDRYLSSAGDALF